MDDLEIVDPHGDESTQIAALKRACETIGFFRIPYSVVDDEVREAAWSDAIEFFAADEAYKMAVAFPEPGYPYGFSPFAYEKLAASTGADSGADLKESFSVGPDCLGPAPPLSDPAEGWIRSPSRWPERPPSLRRHLTEYYRALSDVAARLLSLMAIALDLDRSYFDPMIDRHISALRAVHYPPLPGRVDGDQFRAGAHTDYGTLTILRTDDVPGLEVQGPSGDWTPVGHRPETFVVNLGDSIAQWTNDRWRSTNHRVTTTSSEPRYSMAFFHMANWDARIECLPTCLAPGQRPHHPEVQAGPWLMEKFQKTVQN